MSSLFVCSKRKEWVLKIVKTPATNSIMFNIGPIITAVKFTHYSLVEPMNF